jgi:hypothetical protein
VSLGPSESSVRQSGTEFTSTVSVSICIFSLFNIYCECVFGMSFAHCSVYVFFPCLIYIVNVSGMPFVYC